MAKTEQFTPKQVVDALTATNGLVYLAAEQLKTSARTVYRYAERHKSVKAVLDHQKGKRLDVTEATLWKAVMAGEAWAVCFYLKTQGKARGYVERNEITGADGGPVRCEIVEELADAPRENHTQNGKAPSRATGLSPI